MTDLLSKESDSEILKTFNIEEEKFDHYLGLFSQWIASQKHLQQDFNETCRKKFLLWAKLDFDKAKIKFQKYCYNAVAYEEFVRNRTVTLEGDLMSLKLFHHAPLFKLTPSGYRLWYLKIVDANNFDALAMERYITLACDYVIHKIGMVAGEVGIFDMGDTKPNHYAKMFTPTFLKAIKYNMLNLPFMVKNLYVINCHPFLEKGFAILKTILPQKQADRIVILDNPDDLKKYIPLEFLPEDYGGKLDSLEDLQTQWIKYLVNEKEFLETLSESKPTGSIPAEYQSIEDEFGVEGSFRKLNID